MTCVLGGDAIEHAMVAFLYPSGYVLRTDRQSNIYSDSKYANFRLLFRRTDIMPHAHGKPKPAKYEIITTTRTSHQTEGSQKHAVRVDGVRFRR